MVLPGYRLTATLNVVATFLTFLAAVSLFFGRPQPGPYLLVDDLNNVFIVLTTFVGFTTSVFSASYIGHELAIGRLTPRVLRFYHAMYQVLMFAMNLALVTNNIGVMWVAIELATLTTVLMVGIYRTHEALEAAWKYFILGSVGIALALFGTILVYMAARPVIGEGLDAMVWTVLVTRAGAFDPALLNVAFVFLLLGYGTKVGLAPLHAWLPDAHAEGPTPISAVLSGLLLNVALYALLRFKMLLALNPGALAPGPLMVTMGLISLVFAAFMLYRRRDIKRMFAYSSIEHMGIITFAFGMGGPLANFAGLLHMTMHSLTKSAIFFAVGHIAQVKGTQRIADMGGLTATNPVLGWGLVLGVVAIAGFPPLGIFMSEFLVITSTFARAPWLAIVLAFGILVGVAALFLRLNTIAFGEPRGTTRRSQGLLCADVRASRAGLRRRHLSAAGAGHLVPERRQALGIEPMATLTDMISGELVQGHGGCPRVRGERGRLALRDQSTVGRLLDAARPVGRYRRGAHGRAGRGCARDCSHHDPLFARTASPRSGRCMRRPYVWSGPSTISTASCPWVARRSALARPRLLGCGAPPREARRARRRSVRRTRSCRPRAKTCTRSPSVRFMPASSSLGIFASPPMARPSCGWKSASATSTRASRA